MFELGESLAAARRRQGLELPAVEAATCIRAKHLASLEHERFDALPGRAYARAFLKGYADFLGLETALFLEEFDARWPEEEVEVAPVRIPRRRHVPVGFLLVAAATALILGFVAWSGSGSGSSPKDVGFPAASPPRARAASHPVARHVT